MDKEQVLEEFFKSLRVAITISAIYFKEHPVFANSVENLRTKIYDVLNFISPLKIGITPKSLLVEGRYLEKTKLYQELAQNLHYRKIKAIGIERGVTGEELLGFLLVVSLPLKEIIQKGGLTYLFKEANISHISVHELDYSELLKGGEEIPPDIWISLIEDALKKGSQQELKEFADNFDKLTSHCQAKDFLERPQYETIKDFLDNLKEKSKDKFAKCSKRMIQLFLVDNTLSTEQKLEKIMPLLEGLDEQDFSDILWEGLSKEQGLDSLGMQLFSRLITKEQHKTVAAALSARLMSTSQNRQRLLKKVHDLFLTPDDTTISEIYHNALSSFLQGAIKETSMSIDRGLAYKNYCNILLNIFVVEPQVDKLRFLMGKISEVIDKLDLSADAEYIKNVFLALEMQKKSLPQELTLFKDLEKKASHVIEQGLIDKPSIASAEYFIDMLKETSLDLSAYLNKIFVEGNVNVAILKLFFKFFKKDTDAFYQYLKKHTTDITFLKKILECLRNIDSQISLDILKYIYGVCDAFIKIEVLKAMQSLSCVDSEFLFRLLEKNDFFSKKYAFAVLAKDAENCEEAIQMLLNIISPLGIKNKMLMQNMKVIEELCLKSAIPYLAKLQKRRFIWNKNVRVFAKQVLNKCYNGKN